MFSRLLPPVSDSHTMYLSTVSRHESRQSYTPYRKTHEKHPVSKSKGPGKVKSQVKGAQSEHVDEADFVHVETMDACKLGDDDFVIL